MAHKRDGLHAAKLTAILCAGLALIGCRSIREATAVTKRSPDEFAVLTKAPLVIPPDFNLRPPQPGIASRYESDPAVLAQRLLFPQSAATQATMLADAYSDGEKLLLSKSNALNADPNIRRIISADAGQDDQGLDFAPRVLYEGVTPQPRVANSANAANNTGGIDLPPVSAETTGALGPMVASETPNNAAPLPPDADTPGKAATPSPAAIQQARQKVAATTKAARPAEALLLLRPAYDR